MRSNGLVKYGRALLVVSLTLLGSSASLRADDTEIYQTTYDTSLTGRPKVLIAIDDSGSMGTIVKGQRPPYDPSASYAVKYDATRVYWSLTTAIPSSTTKQYFLAGTNRCAESYSSLTNQGFFQTKARRWLDTVVKAPTCLPATCPASHPFIKSGKCYLTNKYKAPSVSTIPGVCTPNITPGYWDALSTSVPSPRHLECQVDVINSNPSNGSGQPAGYAKNNVLDSEALSAATPTDSDVPWGPESYTFFSAHYLNYLSDASLIVDRTRMAIAKDVITTMVNANTGIDFGLLEFNGGTRSGAPANGGRIVHRIVADMTAAQRTNVVSLVNSMAPGGNTPLCESTFEAYNYLAGNDVLYGLQPGASDVLPRDPLAEKSGPKYISPASDCAYTYVVLMTDGMPNYDDNANAAIELLTKSTCQVYAQDSSSAPTAKNCLPNITEYMANNDLDKKTTNGNQYGITYTIGFTTDQKLLSDAAKNGKGKYFTANDADELTKAFQGAILSILSTDTSFTSPAVAVDTFSRTQSRDDVFYAMFKPEDRIDWRGNIKKLKIDISGGSAILVDANGDPAVDPLTGFIKTSATTFWSPAGDGPSVGVGGVGGLLALRDPATRTIYTSTGTAGALQPFNSTNLNYTAFGFADAAQLFSFIGVPNQPELDKLLAWARGYDVYDEDGDAITSENRPWVLGDILHSQPLVVNYGALGSFTKAEPDLRLVVGTNAGFAHMFGNDNGEEDWAFFPKELAPVLRRRSLNPVSSKHVYGVDNTPVLYTKDVNRDGTLKSSEGDKAYVYLTLRGGGDAIYALDISNPELPSLLWMLDSTKTGFGELGQTWSRPIVTRIPGYVDGSGASKPVLLFGAGYDINKDGSGVATPDSMGRGLFVVDAVTGALVWQVTPAADSAKNMQETGLLHSVAAGLTPLDSNGDEITDRVYFGDTGGNVWRVDMPGPNLPDASQEAFRIIKLAALNGGSVATDRRFFNAPDIVRTSYQGKSFDAVAIGSGDRTNPNSVDVVDQFYMLRDRQVLPYFDAFVRATDCDSDTATLDDFRCELPYGVSSLYDVTANTIQVGSATDKLAAVIALSAANGWRLDLGAPGEKSLAKSITIDGKVYFTTFSPDVDAEKVCEPIPGTGRLYNLRLTDATAIRDLDGDGETVDSDGDGVPDDVDGDGIPDGADLDRFVPLGSLIPETPSPHFGEDGEIRLLLPPGSTLNPDDGEEGEDGEDGCGAGILCSGAALPDPYGTFWYQEEY